jgi:hypothetical protein
MAEAIRVEITGVQEVEDSLRKIFKNVEELTPLHKELGTEIAAKASAIAPKLTGALSASIGSTATNDKVQIYAGNQSVVYAGVQEYGWPEKNIQAQPYLRPSVYNNTNYIVNKYEDYIKSIIRKYD